MLSKDSPNIFQNNMPGNVCFGCGRETKEGLHVKSFWDGDNSICFWNPKEHHQGWKGIMNGGIITTIIDCHIMGTAMAYAYKIEKRELNSKPYYRYATGTIKIRFIKPTPNKELKLRAVVKSYTPKKVLIKCYVESNNNITAEAEVVAFRVFDSSNKSKSLFSN